MSREASGAATDRLSTREKFHFGAYSKSAGYVLSLDPATGQQRWLRDFVLQGVISNDQRFRISSIAQAADGSLYLVAGDTQVLRVTPPSR